MHLPITNNDRWSLHQAKLHTTVPVEASSPLTVSELTYSIKHCIEKNFLSVIVQGEITNCKPHTSGHLYFDLKDSEAKLPAVYFRFKQQGARLPKEGDAVIVRGSLSLYPPHGKYQLIVTELTLAGLGELLLKFEQLKKKLLERGWFDPAHKKPLPRFPKKIGIVTSPTGAVIRDIIQILRRRSPGFHVILYPVLVQGTGAAEQIAEAIDAFNHSNPVDVLIVGRGGGSLEDLWAFNEEVVAKAIFESKIPIVSAVGHESDVTLADFVADVRAPTPSAAAELVSADTLHYQAQLMKARLHLDQLIRNHLDKKYREITALKKHPLLASPLSLFHIPLQRLDHLSGRLDTAIHRYLERRTLELKQVTQELRALDPKNVLGRGYAILFKAHTNHVLTSAQNVPEQTPIKAVLADGTLNLTVTP